MGMAEMMRASFCSILLECSRCPAQILGQLFVEQYNQANGSRALNYTTPITRFRVRTHSFAVSQNAELSRDLLHEQRK